MTTFSTSVKVLGRILLVGMMLPLKSWAESDRAVSRPPLRILASFYPMYIMALNIADGIEGVTVLSLTRPFAGCLHDYQLTPRDVVTLSKADVLIINGGGMEGFVEKACATCPHLKTIDAGGKLHLGNGLSKDPVNPHFWLSPLLAQQQVMTIAEGLAAIDPGRGSDFLERAQAYSNRIELLSRRMHDRLNPFRGRPIITFHEAFPHFAREFNLTVAAVIEREPGSEPSSRELIDTIRLIRSTKGTVLFAEPQYPARAAETIARETGQTVYTLDPLVTGPETPDAYIAGMERNAGQLERAFK